MTTAQQSMLPALLHAIRLFKVKHAGGTWDVYECDDKYIWAVACQFAGTTLRCPHCKRQFLGMLGYERQKGTSKMRIEKMRDHDGNWFDGRYQVQDASGRILCDNFKSREQAKKYIQEKAETNFQHLLKELRV